MKDKIAGFGPGRGAVGTRPGLLPRLLWAGAAPLVITAIPLASAGAQEVVQQLPNPATEQLNDAMRRLARSPTSLPALLDAARASLALDDVDAADGFATRAVAVAPNDGAVIAVRALVALKRNQPQAALELFDQAERAGESLAPYAADQGLAFDLIGENSRAQERYGVALARGETAEVVRRLSLSYAIGGDQAASEATLLPLLQRRDVAAYRTRAFALAVLGREEEGVAIAEAMLPQRLALRMAPYLRNMRALTKSQQAAAGNLGLFPAAAQIGRDGPVLARRAEIAASPAGQADSRLIPGGRPLGPAVAPPPAAPAPEPVQVAAQVPDAAEVDEVFGPTDGGGELPPIAVASPPPAPPPPPPPLPPPSPPPAPVVVATLAEPVVQPPPPTPEEVERQSLAEAFAEFTRASAAPGPAARAGAVDITAIEVARERPPPPPPPPAPPPPPPPPRHPSRIWVQVGTGQNVDAFRFDWRRMVRESDGLFNGRNPFRARWGQTNRLLTGPFANVREANEFVRQLAEKGIDAFRFTSTAGEEVAPLN